MILYISISTINNANSDVILHSRLGLFPYFLNVILFVLPMLTITSQAIAY